MRIAAGIGPQSGGRAQDAQPPGTQRSLSGGCDGHALREIGWPCSKRDIGVQILICTAAAAEEARRAGEPTR
jgi:hypothetical protein